MTAAKNIETTPQDSIARRHALVEQYANLVQRVAYRVLRKLPDGQTSVELEDLFSIGVLGLFDADRKYRPEAGQSFESFAEFRIRGAMLDELRKRDFFPRRLRAKANKLQKAETMLRKSLGREPTIEELAEALEMTVAKLHRLRHAVLPYSFVDQGDPAIQLSCGNPNPFNVVADLENHQLLTEALARLSEREQLVLDLYFQQDMTQREIAGLLNLTEGRISQIKSASLKKLRGFLAERG